MVKGEVHSRDGVRAGWPRGKQLSQRTKKFKIIFEWGHEIFRGGIAGIPR